MIIDLVGVTASPLVSPVRVIIGCVFLARSIKSTFQRSSPYLSMWNFGASNSCAGVQEKYMHISGNLLSEELFKNLIWFAGIVGKLDIFAAAI